METTVTTNAGSERQCRIRIQHTRNSAYYVFQGGKSGSACFFDESCYRFYLRALFSCLKAYRLPLHTYALLPGEVHLLVSGYSRSGLIRVLDFVNSAYGRYFFNRFARHCLPLAGEPSCRRLSGGILVVDCQKYIERTPLRHGLVTMAGEYPWSGFTVNAFGGHGAGLTAHPHYTRLCAEGNCPFQYYRDFIAAPFSDAQEKYLDNRLRRGFPLVESGTGLARLQSAVG